MKKSLIYITTILLLSKNASGQLGQVVTGSIPGVGIDSLLGKIDIGKTIIAPTACVTTLCNTVLPLHLLDFWGKKEAVANHLFWETTSEENVNYYEIQRSTNSVQFNPIGNLMSLNISSKHQYDFTDNFPLPGKNYYRLRMIDIDDKFTYSKTILLERNASGKISLYPNPASHIIKIEIQSLAAGNYEFTITDMAGRKILVEKRTAINGLNYWELNINHIPSGFYILAIRNKKEEALTNIPLEIIH